MNAAAERKSADECSSVHAGERAHLVYEIAVERKAASRIIAERFVGRDPGGEYIIRAEARIYVREGPEAANQKTRSADEQDGKGQLADHQRSAKTTSAGAGGAA